MGYAPFFYSAIMALEIKVSGVTKRPWAQACLKAIKEGTDEIIQVYNQGRTIFVQTQRASLEIGEVKNYQAQAMEENTTAVLTSTVVGGELLVLDANGYEVTQVDTYEDLTTDQLLRVVQGHYRTQPKRYGLLLTLNHAD
jgi:hypothetical protein